MEKLKIIYIPAKHIMPIAIDEMHGFTDDKEFYTDRKALLVVSLNSGVEAKPIVKELNDYYKMFLFEEQPNSLCNEYAYNNVLNLESTYDLIFSLCPYTNEWREKYFDSPKRIAPFFPNDENMIFPSEDKEIDVFWSGTAKAGFISEMLGVITKFNHKIINFRANVYITHIEKMKIHGKSKISVTYSTLFVPKELILLETTPHWKENIAFKDYYESGMLPQIKVRTFDAALSKSIILCQSDPWNVIERWFEPEKEFIYYNDIKDLEEKITEILDNYGDYYHIAENAYDRAINNYTTKHFVEKYIIPNTRLEQ